MYRSIACISVYLALAFSSVSAQTYGVINLPRSLADSGVTVQAVKYHLTYCEGPATDKSGNLFFSEQSKGVLWKMTPDGNVAKWKKNTDSYTNGMDFGPDGYLYNCDKTRICKLDSNSGGDTNTNGTVLKVVATATGSDWAQGANDLSFASDGGLFYSNNSNAVWYRAPDSTTKKYAIAGNGVEYVEEKGILYVNLTGSGKVMAYKVTGTGANRAVDTSAATRKTFCSITGPDGLTIDAHYNVWVASYSLGRINVYDSLGDSIGSVVMNYEPKNMAGNVCNCVFGSGPDNKTTLYMTGDSGCFKVLLRTTGRVRPSPTSVRGLSNAGQKQQADRQPALQLLLGGKGRSWVQDIGNASLLYNLNGKRVYAPRRAESPAAIPGLSPAVLIGR